MTIGDWSETAWQAWVKKDLASLSLDEGDSLLIFHRLMEDAEWRFGQVLTYFSDRPEWVSEELSLHLARLQKLEAVWCEEERFEWCVQVQTARCQLASDWVEWL